MDTLYTRIFRNRDARVPDRSEYVNPLGQGERKQKIPSDREYLHGFSCYGDSPAALKIRMISDMTHKNIENPNFYKLAWKYKSTAFQRHLVYRNRSSGSEVMALPVFGPAWSKNALVLCVCVCVCLRGSTYRSEISRTLSTLGNMKFLFREFSIFASVWPGEGLKGQINTWPLRPNQDR